MLKVKVAHLRAGVEVAQHPIHLERMRRDIMLKPPRDNDLEDIPGHNALSRAHDRGEKVMFCGEVTGRGWRGKIHLGQPRFSGLSEQTLHSIEALLRCEPE